MSTPELRHFSTPPRVFFNERRPPGISFTERMAGFWSERPKKIDAEKLTQPNYEEAFEDGRRAGRRLAFVVTIVAESLDVMLRDPHHPAGFAGTAEITGVPGAGEGHGLLVTEGDFSLFVDDPNGIASKTMNYEARLSAPDGRVWKLTGFKAIRHGGGIAGFVGGDDPQASSPWRDQTRLFIQLTGEGTDALGILTLTFDDFVRQLSTIRALGTTRPVERCDTVARFLMFFVGVLRDTYGGPLARSRYAPPNWWNRKRRDLEGGNGRILLPEGHRFTTDTGVELQLTRYRNARGADTTRRPIMLAPGFGVRADSFAIDTVKPNLVETLCQNGYDVWLFDYRASPELDASREQFSIDDIALTDWPQAVAKVQELTRKPQVDVIAHCIGSMSFMMSALAGRLRGMIGSAVCSQIGAHPVGSHLNQVKALSGLGYWLQILFGKKALRVTVQAADTYHRPLLDRFLKLYPTNDWCDNPVCARIRFVFGESYLHAHLNRGTHDAVIEMFGNPGRDRSGESILERFGDPMEARLAAAGRRVLVRLGFKDPTPRRAAYASLRALGQLAKILTARQLVDEDGGDVYLTKKGLEQLDFRLALMSGRLNRIFPPEGIDATREWLAQARARGETPELRELKPLDFADYAHMDCFIGVNAHNDVFVKLMEWLEASVSA